MAQRRGGVAAEPRLARLALCRGQLEAVARVREQAVDRLHVLAQQQRATDLVVTGRVRAEALQTKVVEEAALAEGAYRRVHRLSAARQPPQPYAEAIAAALAQPQLALDEADAAELQPGQLERAQAARWHALHHHLLHRDRVKVLEAGVAEGSLGHAERLGEVRHRS